MSNLQFVNRNGVDQIDSRILAENLGIKDHKQWLQKTIIPNRKLIKEKTGFDLEFDSVPNKRGSGTKFIWFNEQQIYFVITLGKNTEVGIQAKIMIANKLTELRNQKTPPLVNQWAKRKNQILTNYSTNPNETPRFNPEDIEDFFSPDIVFASFLEKLEGEVNYSLPWQWEASHCEYPEFTVNPHYAEILTQYDKFTDTDDENIQCMWGDLGLPHSPYWCLESEQPIDGVVWLNPRSELKWVWEYWLERAEYCVEVYSSPELRAKYGLPSREVEVTGDFETPFDLTPPAKSMVTANEMLENWLESIPKLYGFQVHKDWLEWLASDDKKAKMVRELYLDSDQPIEFLLEAKVNKKPFHQWEPGESGEVVYYHQDTQILRYDYWEAYENGYQYHLDCQSFTDDYHYEPKLSDGRPLFETIRIYKDKYLPLFDWYLQNIWLPQHSAQYFQTIDPEGLPKLCQAMKALPANSTLPRTFVEAMKPQLTGV